MKPPIKNFPTFDFGHTYGLRLAMALLLFGVLMLAVALSGCGSDSTDAPVAKQPSIENQLDGLVSHAAKVYFDAGVQCAIQAHLQYAIDELHAQRVPIALPVDDWAAKAVCIFTNLNPQDKVLNR